MNVEWTIPFTLTSPYGTFKFNQQEDATNLYFFLDVAKCLAFRGIRQTTDPIPQASGSIVHSEYFDGYSMRLGGWVMLDADNPACDGDLRAGWDQLGLHLNALTDEFQDLDGDNARLQWTPAGYGGDRLLGNIRILEELAPSNSGGGPTEFSFAVHSPYPYAIDLLQTTTSIAEGGTEVVTNLGNCPVYPYFKVYGAPTDTFTLTHAESGKQIVYDSSLPGGATIAAGHYAGIGCFANNIYLDGSGTTLKPGVDITVSDFFPLLPGTNTISYLGAGSADMIWNQGWA